jgi:hypothetical protein
MNVVRLDGGLGNQLFQVSRALTVSNGFYFQIDYSGDVTSLEDLLGKLNRFPKGTSYLKYLLTGNNSFDLNLKRFYKLFPSIFTQYQYWQENRNYNNDRHSVYLDGYWQDLKFVDEVVLSLKTRVSNFEKSESFLKAESLLNSENAVSIHVRRGDYVTSEFSSKFDVCGLEYYSSAIDYVSQNLEDPIFYIFSNDSSWVIENLSHLMKKFVIISECYHFSDVEEMLLLGVADLKIIPNSTFSWWGAMLGGNSDGVICPKSWFRNLDRPCLIRENWIRL